MRIIACIVALALVLLATGCTSTAEPPPAATPTAPPPPILTGTPAAFYDSTGALELDIMGHGIWRTDANVSVFGYVMNPTKFKIGGSFRVRWFDKDGAALCTTTAEIPILAPGEAYRFTVFYDGGTSAAEVHHYSLAPGEMNAYD